MLKLSTKINPKNHCFLVLRRTGFNNIVPYNATRQGMPGYELPGVLRDPLMTVDPKQICSTYSMLSLSNHLNMTVHCFQVAPMEKFDNFTCGRIDLMGDIVTKSAPYLYPFLIEFSLIGAGVLLIMWARIGKNPR